MQNRPFSFWWGNQPYQRFGNEYDFAKLQTWLPAGKISSAGGRRPLIGLVAVSSGFRSVESLSSRALFLWGQFPHSQRASLSFPFFGKSEGCLFPSRNVLSLFSPSRTRLKGSCSRNLLRLFRSLLWCSRSPLVSAVSWVPRSDPCCTADIPT